MQRSPLPPLPSLPPLPLLPKEAALARDGEARARARVELAPPKHRRTLPRVACLASQHDGSPAGLHSRGSFHSRMPRKRRADHRRASREVGREEDLFQPRIRLACRWEISRGKDAHMLALSLELSCQYFETRNGKQFTLSPTLARPLYNNVQTSGIAVPSRLGSAIPGP